MGANSVLNRTLLIIATPLLVAASGMAQILVDGQTTETVMLFSNATFQTVQVTASATTNYTFTVTETDSPGVQWLRAFVGVNCNLTSMPPNCAQGNMSSASGTATTTPTTMTIQLNIGLTTQAHATVTLTPMGSSTPAATINVVFTPGQGSTGSTPVTPSTLTVCAANGGSTTSTLTLQNNTGGSITITGVAPATTESWLSGSANPTTVPANGSSIITVAATGTGFSNVTLSDSLVITISNQPMVSVPVTFNVGPSSGLCLSTSSVAFAYPSGTQQQGVTVAGAASYNANATTMDGNKWLLLSAGSQSGSQQVSSVPAATPLTVYVGSVVGALATGNYTGSVVVTDASNSNNTATISVALSVNTSGSTSITVSPAPPSGSTAPINFYSQTKAGISVPTQSLWLSAPTGTFTAAVTSNNTPWLFLGASGGQIPGSLQVFAANLGGLTAGTYKGQITLTAGSLTQTVNVNLTITDNPVAFESFTSGGTSSGTVIFTSASAASQQVAVYASDGTGDALTLSNIVAPNWLTVTQSMTSSGQQAVTVTPHVSGQAAALYSDYVTLTATNAANNITNNPVLIPVVLATNGTGGPLTITSTQALTFQSSTSGAVTPSSVTVSVSALTPTPFTVSTQTPWISIQQGSFVTNQNFTVSVTPGTLAPMSTPYTGEIDFTANGVTQRLTVSLTVLGGPNAGSIMADKQSLTFTGVAGGQPPPSPVINVTSNGASVAYTVSVSTQAGGAWLSSDTTTKSTPSAVTITANPTTLAPGTYQGTVTITGPANTLTIPVSFNVQAPPAVSAAPTNLTFTYFSGGSVPPAQNIMVSGSTGGFTATAASDTGSWLSVTPTSGAPGTNISVSVNPAGVAIGQHTGTVTIAGTGALTGQAVVNVSLTITAPLPSISSATNAASYVQFTVSAGEVITMMGGNLAPPGQQFTAQLDANGNLATELGGVQVLVDGFVAPMVYASATQVSAVVPYEVAPFPIASVSVKYLGQTSNVITLPVVPAAPGIFTQNEAGSGAAGFNGDFSVNGPSNPAPKGSTMVFFLTGEGQTNPLGVTGKINSSQNMNPVPQAPITVTIDGQPTTYSYAGGIEGVVQGILQLNAQIPATARSGTVPVVVTIGGVNTQSGVTVSVK